MIKENDEFTLLQTPVIVAIGSNLGNRYHYLLNAQKALYKLPLSNTFHFSSIYEAPSIPIDEAPNYLNAVIRFNTHLKPHSLLKYLLEIEKNNSRQRPYINAPRTLDLDLIFYGDKIIHAPDLIVPHPRMHERFFVLTPLTEIQPDCLHPLLKKTVAHLEEDLKEKYCKENYIKHYEETFESSKKI